MKLNFLAISLLILTLFKIAAQDSSFDNSLDSKDSLYLLQSSEHLLSIANQKELKTLEQDILKLVENLKPKLKEKLGNWSEKFNIFKNKINMLKPYIQELKAKNIFKIFKQLNLLDNPYSFLGDTGLYTAIGLKPVSYPEEGRSLGALPINIIKSQFNGYPPYRIINNKYQDSIIVGNLKKEDCPYTNCIYIATQDPILPIDFIIANYKDKINVRPEFTKDFKDISKLNSDEYKKTIEKWVKKERRRGQTKEKAKISTTDEAALILGLQPLVLSQKIAKPFNPENFKYLALPPTINTNDNTAYMQLYSKLMEYLWLSLAGTKKYLIKLGKGIYANKHGNTQESYQIDSWKAIESAYKLLKALSKTKALA